MVSYGIQCSLGRQRWPGATLEEIRGVVRDLSDPEMDCGPHLIVEYIGG